MSKMAEKRALEAYPISVSKNSVEAGFDWNEEYRDVFMEGYNQAMEDIMEKAVEWLEYNFNMPGDFKEHFTKAMEG